MQTRIATLTKVDLPWGLPAILGALALLVALPQITPAGESGLVRREFREVDTLFANPGQGWMSQQRSPRTEPRFPCSVVYIRFNWTDAEPEEGRFSWKLIDDVIAAWKPRGAAVSMRVMTCNAHSGGYYTSPKWLFDEGCRSFEYLAGGGQRGHSRKGTGVFLEIEVETSGPSYALDEPVESLGRVRDELRDGHHVFSRTESGVGLVEHPG